MVMGRRRLAISTSTRRRRREILPPHLLFRIEPTQQPKSGAPTPDGADAAVAMTVTAAEAGEERNVVASEPATRAGSEEAAEVDGIRLRASSLPADIVPTDPSAPAPKPAGMPRLSRRRKM